MLWDKFVDHLIALCFPLVCFYHAVTENVFLNTANQDAVGLEKIADTFLIPFQYVFAGKIAIQEEDHWEFSQRFDYMDFWLAKTGLSLMMLPSSLFIGTAAKGAAYFFTPYRDRHREISRALNSAEVRSKNEYYREIGLKIVDSIDMETFTSEGYARRVGDENHLKEGKEALGEIIKLLNQENIVWWLDCGTCLGAYRYGGVIPWDIDVDIAVLLPDFENILHALKKLDPKKYAVQDWSSRELPKSLIRVVGRDTNMVIDIYHFAIDPIHRQLKYILSLENNIFMPEWWKIRERRFKEPVNFEDLFPLKKGTLDGLEVYVPKNPKKYLQRCYGEDLSPAKLYCPDTDSYEKDLSHPYWQRLYAH